MQLQQVVVDTMILRLRRLVQTVFVVLFAAYCTLLTYQSLSHVAVHNQPPGSRKNVTSIEDYHYFFGAEPAESVFDNSNNMAPNIATIGPPTTFLDDIFISVKTTKNYHRSRVPLILKTWFRLAKTQTWFFTDTNDDELQTQTDGHMINTKCSSSHSRKALCCKLSVEFDTFLDSGKKWFCHFDDDNYVNVPRLVRFLGNYNPMEDWYLGKTSIQAPLEIVVKDKTWLNVKFWFATGGAGFCISRALALKMLPIAGGGKFISIGEKIRLPDDVTMGYIIEHLLKKPLTVVDQFHSHLEPMKFIRGEFIKEQISFSYSRTKNDYNVVKIDGFSKKYDPTRFLSIHCYLFPHAKLCPL